MRHRNLAQLIPLALCIAFAPVQAAVAADPSTQDEATAEDTQSLAAVSAGKLASNGTSLSGRIEGADRRGRIVRNGTSLSGSVESGVRHGRIARNGRNLNGHKLNGNGGMTVVSIELPGGARHAK